MDQLCKTPKFKWFGLALQALVVLSQQNNEPCPSHSIALAVQSEPTLIRRILSQLAAADLIETREGRVGGYKLKKAPECITLAEVYLALEATELFWGGMIETLGSDERVEKMKGPFGEIINRISSSMLSIFEQYTIADLIKHCPSSDNPSS